MGAAPLRARDRLCQKPERGRSKVGERAARDDLRAEDDDDVWLERTDGTEHCLDVGASAELEETGVGAPAPFVQGANFEERRLADEGKPHGRPEGRRTVGKVGPDRRPAGEGAHADVDAHERRLVATGTRPRIEEQDSWSGAGHRATVPSRLPPEDFHTRIRA